jgi:hypothetical protein
MWVGASELDRMQWSQNKRKNLIHMLHEAAAHLDWTVCIFYDLKTALLSGQTIVRPTLHWSSESRTRAEV